MKKQAFFFLKTMLLLFAFTLAIGCDKDDDATPALNVAFENAGLKGRIVYELTLHDNKLYAATDTGLFVKQLASNSNWTASGLAGKKVRAFIALSNQNFLASIVDSEVPEFKLFKSENGGQNWTEVVNNFGGGEPEPIYDLEFNATKNELLATGLGVVAKSTDNGQNWTVINGGWQTFASGSDFVMVNPKTNDIWTGGQNAIEEFVLSRIAPNGTVKTWRTLLPSPSVPKDLAFHPTENNTLIVGAEDGILKSTNNGEAWSTIKKEETARFFFGVDFDKKKPSRIYATSWVKNFDTPQHLILYVSEDGGTTWKEYKHNDNNLFGGVWDMQQISEANQTTLYVGLYKGGVYKVTVRN